MVLSQGGSHHANLCKYSFATSSQVTFIPPTHTNPALNGGVGVEGDYMNPFPEGLLHTYSNEGDLLQQVSVGRGTEVASSPGHSQIYVTWTRYVLTESSISGP